jgi:hypothetical protein
MKNDETFKAILDARRNIEDITFEKLKKPYS